MRPHASLPLFAAAATAQATAGPYGQCGGIGYSGPSACGSGYGCTTYNPYYAQCYPGVVNTPTSTPSSTSSLPPTTSTTRTSSSSTTTYIQDTASPLTTTRTSTTTTTTTTGSIATPTTLEPGWYWIRAVASPYYRSYLQAAPTPAPTTSPSTPGGPNALISNPSRAGQFNVISGQLVWHRFGGQQPMYMHVEDPADRTQRKLRTWFAASPNAHGTFGFQGDTLTWSVADISRPNAAAWLVCAGDELFVNTGPFLYQTPAGCFDHTIHSYGGSKADV
ncbi:carbohydrate-binding module family 1 protein [Parathielavia hyrcaniae]|uniref:Carbohydrate-binding module family 1 protein n=1 Tax=Parathielavia hyrcaniae TaxID=113614 RepID=A0AAN6PSQ8_9PEZI|nr:carbohydrate-binding module family 1 protein [Parathielavia hyrcaniae]